VYLRRLTEQKSHTQEVIAGVDRAFDRKYMAMISQPPEVFTMDLAGYLGQLDLLMQEVYEDLKFIELESLGWRVEATFQFMTKGLHYCLDMWRESHSKVRASQERTTSRKLCSICENIIEKVNLNSLELVTTRAKHGDMSQLAKYKQQ
jgi:hypothetical protein